MNALRQALADYLAVRRILGYRLARAEKLLAQFLTFVEERGEEHLTTETALAWATLPAGADRSWMSRRLSDVRRFAIHLHGIDPATQVPPVLSTYLGHINPSHTYWYLSAAPELLKLASDRLERHLGGDA